MKFASIDIDSAPMFIAEVGQNHQGSLDHALEYISVFSQAGATAVKFQKRDNKSLFDEEKYNEPYEHENSFGITYGEHRENLELKPNWLGTIRSACTKNDVLFMCTPFDENSLELLLEYDVDILKVASFDLGNIPFLQKIAASGKPVVISTGGGQAEHIDFSINALKNAESVAILHCVSEYPCPPEKLDLNSICALIEKYPDCAIGLSDHFSGTLSGPIGYMKGARIFEKHVTLNRAWKGTDHSFALEPVGFKNFVRDVKRVPIMETNKKKQDIGQEFVFRKLGKSIVASRSIETGELLTADNLTGRIISTEGIAIRQIGKLIGKKSNRKISQLEPLSENDYD